MRELEKAAKAGGGGARRRPTWTRCAGGAERGDGSSVLVAEAPAGMPATRCSSCPTACAAARPVGGRARRADDGEACTSSRSLTPEAVEAGLDAVAVIRGSRPLVGGGGGGRPPMARAGGKDASRLDEALDAARALWLSLE